MKCLVTGGNGFIGSHLVDILLQKKHKVTIFDKKKYHSKKKNLKIVYGDLKNTRQLKKAVKNQDFVFHFGGLSGINESLEKPLETAKTNILSTLKLLELSRQFKLKRFVYASSVYVNSDQGGFYKSSKKAAEDYIEEYYKRYKLNFTILRFGTIYGTRANKENTINNIIDNANKFKKVIYQGNKKNLREYINVLDAAKAGEKIMSSKYKNQFITITGKRKIPVTYLLTTIKKLLKLKKKIIFKNKKQIGHYLKEPNTFKPRIGKKIMLDDYISLEKGIKIILESKNI